MDSSPSEPLPPVGLPFYSQHAKKRCLNIKHQLENFSKRLREQIIPKAYNSRILGPSVRWQVFYRQQEALDFVRSKTEDFHVFAFESSQPDKQSGQRQFLTATYPVFWHYYMQLPDSQRHHYEVIPEGHPCKLYFDLEFQKADNPTADGITMVDILIKYVCCWLKVLYDVHCDRATVLELSASTETKFSRHLIFQHRGSVFKDNVTAGHFVRTLFDLLDDYLCENSQNRKDSTVCGHETEENVWTERFDETDACLLSAATQDAGREAEAATDSDTRNSECCVVCKDSSHDTRNSECCVVCKDSSHDTRNSECCVVRKDSSHDTRNSERCKNTSQIGRVRCRNKKNCECLAEDRNSKKGKEWIVCNVEQSGVPGYSVATDIRCAHCLSACHCHCDIQDSLTENIVKNSSIGLEQRNKDHSCGCSSDDVSWNNSHCVENKLYDDFLQNGERDKEIDKLQGIGNDIKIQKPVFGMKVTEELPLGRLKRANAAKIVDDLMSKMRKLCYPVFRQFDKEQLRLLFVNDKDGRRTCFADLGVYTKNRNFRLYKSCKLGKKAAFTVAEHNTCIFAGVKEREVFLASLITNVSTGSGNWLTFEDGKSPTVSCHQSRRQNSSAVSSLATGDHIEGFGKSPYPEVDNFISSQVSGHGGSIRRWTYFPAAEILSCDIAGYRFCYNIQRQHRSNNIRLVADLQRGVWYQKCYDPDCQAVSFKSQEFKLPKEILPSHFFTDDFEDECNNSFDEDDEACILALQRIEEATV